MTKLKKKTDSAEGVSALLMIDCLQNWQTRQKIRFSCIYNISELSLP